MRPPCKGLRWYETEPPLFFMIAKTLFSFLVCFFWSLALAQPTTFYRAKIELKNKVYFDQNQSGQLGTLYCGCDWHWAGVSGGRVDFDSCGYRPRAQMTRAQRIEWEHIVPASSMGMTRQCWQNGGRSNCNRTDPVFNKMEADMHNLSPSVGDVNADRSNFHFGVLPTVSKEHGVCDFKVDKRRRVAEPRDAVKGMVARVYFYVHDRYKIEMSPAQERLFMAWHHRFPVSAWELERDHRITKVMGHSNPFVTGERQWTQGRENLTETAIGATTSGKDRGINFNAP